MANFMANNKNLDKDRKATQFTAGIVATSNGSKGGLQTVKNNKIRKTLAELGKAMMDSSVTPEQLKEVKTEFPSLSDEEVTNRVLMLRKQMQKAIIDGDTKAFEVIRDTIGEKPEPPTPQDKGGQTIYNIAIATKVTNEALRKLINVTPVKMVKKIEDLI